MISRRTFNQILSSAGVLAAAGWPFQSMSADLTHNDDGLIYQPWFLESFLILNEDLADAHADGKRFAVFWELKGCPYCEETHRVNLAIPEILDYVTSNFAVMQLNIIGSRIVTDFDGEELSEKDLARKWGVKFTPTLQFFGDDPEAIAGKPGRDGEVARIPGYFKPEHFFAMFRYVKEKAYEDQKFHSYVRNALKG